MSRVRPLMDVVRLVGTSTSQENTISRRPPKNKRQPLGNLHSREDLLVRTQDRESQRVVRPRIGAEQ